MYIYNTSHGSPSVTNASGSSLANLPTNGVTYSDLLNQPNETEADEDEDRLHPYSERDVLPVIEPEIAASISIGDPRARIKELEGQLQSAKILCDRVKQERDAFKGRLVGVTADMVCIERERESFKSEWNNAQIALDAKEKELAARTATEVEEINNELKGLRVALAFAKRKVHELSQENKALAARQAKVAKKEEELTKKEEEMTKTKFTLATRDEELKNTLAEN
jgi:chromosome segregation ATPase